MLSAVLGLPTNWRIAPIYRSAMCKKGPLGQGGHRDRKIIGKAIPWNSLVHARNLPVPRRRLASAIAALEKSLELTKVGEYQNWFFLAMAHWQLEHKDLARKFYSQAVAAMEREKENDTSAQFRPKQRNC